jgi:sulfane dehydrogenase subunit SoxC
MKRSAFLITAGSGATQIAALPAPGGTLPNPSDAPIAPYGVPSRFEDDIIRRPRGLPSPALTPLAAQLGIITPNGLTFVRNHAGTPALDPKRHQLTVHGLVGNALTFTLADILRFPSVERMHFLECAGNSARGWQQLGSGVQFSHGLLSGCLWTGVPLRLLLDEAGVKPEARWFVAEGADGALFDRSIPLAKALDDALLVYGQNGEMLRPEQGYPLRLILPGFEGSTNIKWLRRIKLVAAPVYSREETAQYSQAGPDGKVRLFDFVMEAKSVITLPSPTQRLSEPGFYEGRGFAWSGRGRIKGVEVSYDAGSTWTPAVLDDINLPKSLVRFTFPLRWTGNEMTLASRATDESGYAQPTLDQLTSSRGTSPRYHVNAITHWRILRDGSVVDADA